MPPSSSSSWVCKVLRRVQVTRFHGQIMLWLNQEAAAHSGKAKSSQLSDNDKSAEPVVAELEIIFHLCDDNSIKGIWKASSNISHNVYENGFLDIPGVQRNSMPPNQWGRWYRMNVRNLPRGKLTMRMARGGTLRAGCQKLKTFIDLETMECKWGGKAREATYLAIMHNKRPMSHMCGIMMGISGSWYWRHICGLLGMGCLLCWWCQSQTSS